MAPAKKKAIEVHRAQQNYKEIGAKGKVQSSNTRSKKKVAKQPPPNDSKAKRKQRTEALKVEKEIGLYNAQQDAIKKYGAWIEKKPIAKPKALTIKKKKSTPKHKMEGRKSRKAQLKEWERARAEQWAKEGKNNYNKKKSNLDEESSEESELEEEDSEMESNPGSENEFESEDEEDEEQITPQFAPAPAPRYNPVEVPHDPHTYSSYGDARADYGPAAAAYQPIRQEPIAYHYPMEPTGVAAGGHVPAHQAPSACITRQQPLRPSRTVEEPFIPQRPIMQDEALEELDIVEDDTEHSKQERPRTRRWQWKPTWVSILLVGFFGAAGMAFLSPKSKLIAPGYETAAAAPAGACFEDNTFDPFSEPMPTPAHCVEGKKRFPCPGKCFGGKLSSCPEYTSMNDARTECRLKYKLQAKMDSLFDWVVTHTKQCYDLAVCEDPLFVEWLGRDSPMFDFKEVL